MRCDYAQKYLTFYTKGLKVMQIWTINSNKFILRFGPLTGHVMKFEVLFKDMYPF